MSVREWTAVERMRGCLEAEEWDPSHDIDAGAHLAITEGLAEIARLTAALTAAQARASEAEAERERLRACLEELVENFNKPSQLDYLGRQDAGFILRAADTLAALSSPTPPATDEAANLVDGTFDASPYMQPPATDEADR